MTETNVAVAEHPKPILPLQERLVQALEELVTRAEEAAKNEYKTIKLSELKIARSLIKEARKPPKKKKPPSRNDRWSSAASDAMNALEELRGVQEEFEEWQGNLPENLQNSALGEKLQAVCDLDISSALDTATEAEGMDLPLGFGRD